MAAATAKRRKSSKGKQTLAAAADVVQVPLKLIEADGAANHRLKGPFNEQKLAELKASMERGLEQPILVYQNGDKKKFLLGFGYRRRAAAELLGWETIGAQVRPIPLLANGDVDQVEIERVRAVENLDRQDLNPMEEAVVVADMIAAVQTLAENPEDAHSTAIEQVALRLGRPESWVRDRTYLARLCAKVRGWVIDGSLALGFAREISKLGDHGDQEDIADHARVKDDGKSWASIREVKQMVEQRMRSLKIVPWKLEAAFPRQKPIVGACAGCPFNTATDKNLFEHDAKAPEDGICMKGDCFEAKEELTRKELQKAADKIIKKELPATATSAAELVPDFAKPASAARLAKKQMDNGGSSSGKPTRAPKERKKSYEDLVREATWKFQDAMRDWGDKCADDILKAARERPGGIVILKLCDLTPASGWQVPPKSFAKAKSALDVLFGDDAIGPALVKFEKLLGDIDETGVEGLRNEQSPLRDYIAKKWGLTFDAPPEKSSFMPKKPKDGEAAEEAAGAVESSDVDEDEE